MAADVKKEIALEIAHVLDRAIEVLDGLLSRPSGVTVQGLKVNPIWDPLRSEPRFQKLVAEPAAK